MKLLGIGPGRQPGYRIKRAQQASDDLFRIIFRAELFELSEHPGERFVCFADGALGKVLPLLREALAVSDELFAVEVGRDTDTRPRSPVRAAHACHATRVVHIVLGESSVNGTTNACQRFRIICLPHPPRHDIAAEASEQHPTDDQQKTQLDWQKRDRPEA